MSIGLGGDKVMKNQGRWCINSDRNKRSAEKVKFKADLAQPEQK
jgi:hypothetical protein